LSYFIGGPWQFDKKTLHDDLTMKLLSHTLPQKVCTSSFDLYTSIRRSSTSEKKLDSEKKKSKNPKPRA